jgi:hypothetical protein
MKVNYSRKKSQSQNNNSGFSGGNQQRNKTRFSGGQGHNNNGRPRKNYGAMREKYLAQARDAMASGDRVLAENYFQHADHCFRMIAEENASRPQRSHNHHEPQEQQAPEVAAEQPGEEDDSISTNVTSLPAFLTANYEPKKEDAPVIVPNWEEE